MEHKATGNLNDSPASTVNTDEWKHINISEQSLDHFTWEIICDERWEDPQQALYECHRITRRADALGGHLYAVATHISPNNKSLAPSVSESLIFVPLDKVA